MALARIEKRGKSDTSYLEITGALFASGYQGRGERKGKNIKIPF